MALIRSRWSLAIIAFAALVIGAQVVPYGREHASPPVAMEPAWDSATTRQIASRACFDCHSNQTRWPAYANVAPVSWLVEYDVREGRHALNFSEWNRAQEEAHEAPEVVMEKEMPPLMYRLLHPEARLDNAEREILARGLANTIGAGGEAEDEEDHDD